MGSGRAEGPREPVRQEHDGGSAGRGAARAEVSLQRETRPDPSHEEAPEIRQPEVTER